MDAAQQIAPLETERLLWAEICSRYPDEYVCIVDADKGTDGAIRSGRVSDHDRSMRHLLARIDGPQPTSVIVQTSGRALRFPHIEMTDEIRNIIRPQR
jgi:hypothetical protein